MGVEELPTQLVVELLRDHEQLRADVKKVREAIDQQVRMLTQIANEQTTQTMKAALLYMAKMIDSSTCDLHEILVGAKQKRTEINVQPGNGKT